MPETSCARGEDEVCQQTTEEHVPRVPGHLGIFEVALAVQLVGDGCRL
jgi:hypothetical protein